MYTYLPQWISLLEQCLGCEPEPDDYFPIFKVCELYITSLLRLTSSRCTTTDFFQSALYNAVYRDDVFICHYAAPLGLAYGEPSGYGCDGDGYFYEYDNRHIRTDNW